MLTQRGHYDLAAKRMAEINDTFLILLPTLTHTELTKLIAKRPALWSRFAGYLPMLAKERP